MDMKGFGERFGLRFDHVGCAVNDLERISEFYAGLGYGNSGSGTAIPAYAPLRFDFEIVRKKE